MKMRFPKLQDNNKEVKKLRAKKLLKGWKDIECDDSMSYVICTSCYPYLFVTKGT